MTPGPWPTSGYPRRTPRARLIVAIVIGAVLYVMANVGFILTMGSTHAAMYRRQHIDDPSLLEAIGRACDGLQADLEAISTRDAERVRHENSAVERFVDRVERSTSVEVRADDPPTEDWLDDWLRLVAVRDGYAQALDRRAHAPRPRAPQDGDTPITVRMRSAQAGCDVPLAITDDLVFGQ